MVMVLRFWLIGMNEESPVNFERGGECPRPFMPNLPKYRNIGLLMEFESPVAKICLSLGTVSANAFFSHLIPSSIAFVPFFDFYRIREPSRRVR